MDLNNLAASGSIVSPLPPGVAPTASATARPAPEENPYEPMVHGESTYDRVTSMLMSVVVGAALIVGWLWLIYATQNAYTQRIPSALELVEVYGGGGGDPAGELGGSESVDIAGASASGAASNNTAEDASLFEEPAVQTANSPALDAIGSATDDSESVDVGSDTPRGGAFAGGRKSSKVGNGRIGLGPGGPGDGGVAAEQRWVIQFPPGQSADEYARQLDAFKVELATINGSNTLIYASNFTGKPITRTGLNAQEKRYYNTWQSQVRKQFDSELMKRAGIDAGSKPILQFYPEGTRDKLRQLEVAYKGRQPGEIRLTRFTVVPAGGTFTFQVVSQDALR